MATAVMKMEMDADTCSICGVGGELMTPEEHDASAPPMQVPLRVMLLHLNNNKVLPEGRFCINCARRAIEAYEFSSALTSNSEPPLSEKIRALRRKLNELTQKIDVFIVVGGAGAGGSYSEEDIIMVEREALAAAAAADDEDLEKARNARGDTVYQCSVCPESFQRVSEYRAHAATHPEDALHSCWTCGAQFATRAAHREHARTHGDEMPLVCNLCNTQLQSQSELRRHISECTPQCPACGVSAVSRAALSAHVTAAHGRGASAPHVCSACFAVLPRSDLFTAHMLRHRQAKQFVCGYDGCILRFATRSNLMSHIRKCHGGGAEEPDAERAPDAPADTTCDQCGRAFASVAAMKRHARVHRSVRAHEPAVVQAQEAEVEYPEGSEVGEVEYLEVETLEDVDYHDMDAMH